MDSGTAAVICCSIIGAMATIITAIIKFVPSKSNDSEPPSAVPVAPPTGWHPSSMLESRVAVLEAEHLNLVSWVKDLRDEIKEIHQLLIDMKKT